LKDLITGFLYNPLTQDVVCWYAKLQMENLTDRGNVLNRHKDEKILLKQILEQTIMTENCE